ncbi:hypothetical protein QBC35DRAFT_274004 [Podospora australis]|uniref:Uncharacterized protein n=1 Tax=Podospora australis TaxID=1536484 RepID=A0AAN6WQH4_9PEZI|nr:hypothetical protein QBC35DRAFT_274004 [Podospora australis]
MARALLPRNAFIWNPNTNFSDCYHNYVSQISQNCSDPNQVCMNDTYGEITHPGLVFLSYGACLRECGDGYGLWEVKDILLRISLWVVPAIVLVAHYHFPPLGAWNTISVVVHILADPIDTLWCLLTRITVRRHLLQKAQNSQLLSAGAIATVWAAYDELGFQDPTPDFQIGLDKLRGLQIPIKKASISTNEQREVEIAHGQRYPENFLALREGRLPDRSGTSKSLEAPISISEKIGKFFLSDEVKRTRRLERWKRAIKHLTDYERMILYRIEVAAQRLVFNRDESLLTTWISIVGLLSALMGAFVRTWTERLNNQTAHTIATVTLLLVVVPIVKLSGNIGSFTSSTAAVDIVQRLRKDLDRDFGSDVAALFPPLIIPSEDEAQQKGYLVIPDEEQNPEGERIPLADLAGPPLIDEPSAPSLTTVEDKQLLLWPTVAAYSGMNSSYRPFKTSPLVPFRLSITLLAVSATWILAFCYAPALVISFLTPLKGFACRSLAWTVIATCWVVSVILDFLFIYLHKRQRLGLSRPRVLWGIIYMRDTVLALFIAVIVTAQQLGIYNSCYCRSGELSRVFPSYVNLNPFTQEQFIEGWTMWVPTPGAAFLLSMVGIVCIERRFSDSGKLLSRNKVAREKMLLHLRMLETKPARGTKEDKERKRQRQVEESRPTRSSDSDGVVT